MRGLSQAQVTRLLHTGRVQLMSVDFQNDFVAPGGAHYGGHPCVEFITSTLVPFARANGIRLAEIVSDYRSPRADDAGTTCIPGRWGYESAIPRDLTLVAPWVKASISPTWVRDGGGHKDLLPGPARPDPLGFRGWLSAAIGPPSHERPVVLVGLMLEVCVLATLIEVSLRGYPTRVLTEGVDRADGDQRRKSELLATLASFWGPPVTWNEFMDSRRV